MLMNSTSEMRTMSHPRAFTLRAVGVVLCACLWFTSCVYTDLRSKMAGSPAVDAPADGYGSVGKFPFKEAWYGMYFHEDKVGYSHYRMEPAGDNFIIHSESLMRLTAMKNTNEVQMKEAVTVRPDLSMIAFDSSVRMNETTLKMNGNMQADLFLISMDVDGQKMNREYPVEGKLYHTSAISLLPALKGLKEGRTNSFTIFNPEKQGMDKIEQLVMAVKGEPGPNNAVWKVKNNYGNSVVYSWLNPAGQTVLEKALEGQLITVVEDETTAKKFLEKKKAGRDVILDLSLVKTAKPLPTPSTIRFLKLKVSGVDPSLIPEDHRQKKSDVSGDSFALTVTSEDVSRFKEVSPKGQAMPSGMENYLASTVSIPATHPEIVDQSNKIVSKNDSPFEKVAQLNTWTAKNITGKMQDSFTALAVLRSKGGECQAHANLYTALARAQNIPSRVITGLVYSEGLGFLYHAWAESYVNGWLAVDPTFGQLPADATHIKINEDGSDGAQSLMKLVGKIKIEPLDYKR